MIQRHDQNEPDVTVASSDHLSIESDRGRTGQVVSVIPTLFTLGNLVCGFAAIHYATRGAETLVAGRWSSLGFAGALIFLGMLLDAVDGSVARLVKSESEIGAQIDSLADMVTFGVAPAFLTLQLASAYLATDGFVVGPGADSVIGKLIWASGAVYICGACLRLAKYNIEALHHIDEEPTGETRQFRGLPTPGAAGALASLVLLHQHLLVDQALGEAFGATATRVFTLGIPAVMLFTGLAMVSALPYVHFTNRFIMGQRSFSYFIRILIPLMLCIWWLPEVMALVFTTYVLSGPVVLVSRALRSSKHVVSD